MERKEHKHITQYFIHKLRYIGICTIVAQFLLIGMNLIKADGLAALLDEAAAGNQQKTLHIAVVLISILCLGYVFKTVLTIVREQKLCRIKHSCQMEFMHEILRKSTSEIYGAKEGEYLENLTDDLSKTIEYYGTQVPMIGCALVQVILYSGYLFVLDPSVPVILLMIG